MKKTVVLFLCILLWPAFILAGETKFVFWYPGEAGGSVEAQPILDEFFKYINQKVPGLNAVGRYFNTAQEGLEFISKQKPPVGIISFAAWDANRAKFPNAQIWLATNPFPHGQKKESYFLVGKKPLAASDAVFSSEPLGKDFVKNRLGFDVESKPQATSQILLKLKSIADGTTAGAAILSPTEGATFIKMTAPWTKQLKVIAKSKPVPTARVVLFGGIPKDGEKLKQALLNLNGDLGAKEILEELRLVGFSEP